MKRVKKHNLICLMLVVMMTILALLSHMSLAIEQNSYEMQIELEEVQTKEVLPLEVKTEAKEIEVAIYAGVAMTCPLLLMLGTGLYKRRKVENINYW